MTHFVEMWVDPFASVPTREGVLLTSAIRQDPKSPSRQLPAMFRPCLDPGIDDEYCELSSFPIVEHAHEVWMTAMRRALYEAGSLKFPWTRLGYTYDWGNSETPVGASEFVVREGAKVTIALVQATENYIEPI